MIRVHILSCLISREKCYYTNSSAIFIPKKAHIPDMRDILDMKLIIVKKTQQVLLINQSVPP